MAGGLESLALLPLISTAAGVGSMAVPNRTAKRVLGGVGLASGVGSLAGFNPTMGSTFGMGAGAAPGIDVTGSALDRGPLPPGGVTGTAPEGMYPGGPDASAWKDRLSMMRDVTGLAKDTSGFLSPLAGAPKTPAPPVPRASTGDEYQPSAYNFIPSLTELLRGPRDQDRVGRLLRGQYGMA